MSTDSRIPRIFEQAPDFKAKSTHGVADLNHNVSQAYGLMHEAVSDTATVRAVFAIDPKQIFEPSSTTLCNWGVM
jgi:hypothetical protein